MKYLYGIFLGIIVIGGIWLTVHYGLQPKTLPKIKPSQVTTPERLGEAVAKRLWLELRDNPLVFLGVDPDSADDYKVWKGFFESLPPELKYSVIVIDPELPNKALIPFTQEVDIKNDRARFIEGMRKALNEGLRMAVVVPSIYSTQSLRDNPVYHIKGDTGILPITISVARPTMSRREEVHVKYPCVTGSGDFMGLGQWGCLIQSRSRALYRKEWKSQEYLGLMDQVGGTDYLVLLRYIE